MQGCERRPDRIKEVSPQTLQSPRRSDRLRRLSSFLQLNSTQTTMQQNNNNLPHPTTFTKSTNVQIQPPQSSTAIRSSRDGPGTNQTFHHVTNSDGVSHLTHTTPMQPTSTDTNTSSTQQINPTQDSAFIRNNISPVHPQQNIASTTETHF